MAARIDAEGYELEVLGSCMTNTRTGSQFKQTVEARYLWSFAQEEALLAICEQGTDTCWRLIQDPERRAKRIAARYADLYFKSADKSKGKLQLYWPALAAFVVKDIVEAFRYAREDVLEGGWRTWDAAKLGALGLTKASPYEHAVRVYAALAKGNLWLFEDIYPWLWFVLEYGVRANGELNEELLKDHVDKRDAATLQAQSRQALQDLPFGANWLERMKKHFEHDPVYRQASALCDAPVSWQGPADGYGQALANHRAAHAHVRQHLPRQGSAYQIPEARRWSRFNEAYYVLDEMRRELRRMASDGAAASSLQRVAQFKATGEIREAYGFFIEEHAAATKDQRFVMQKKELMAIAKQEQLNVLQPLLYDDPKLKQTMDANHQISRYSGGFLSPRYEVVYSASPKVDAPELKTVFDAPDGLKDWATGPKQSLPNQEDRMAYVGQIANRFNDLMSNRRAYMNDELSKIRGWLNA